MIADLSSFSKSGGVHVGQCSLHRPAPTEVLPAHVMKRPRNHKAVRVHTSAVCVLCSYLFAQSPFLSCRLRTRQVFDRHTGQTAGVEGTVGESSSLTHTAGSVLFCRNKT